MRGGVSRDAASSEAVDPAEKANGDMRPLTLDEIASVVQARPLGRSGRHLVDSVGIDSRQVKSGEVFFAIRGERFDGHAFVASAIDQGAMAAVVSRPELVPSDLRELGLLLLVDDTLAALGRLAAYHRHKVRATVIAVTGSNGKTTTKEMIDHVLSGRRRGRGAPKSFNNAVGVPLTLLSVEPDDDYVVAEIGSSAPGEVAHLAEMAAPDIGVITSVAETHLEQLGSLAGVAREKASLVDHVVKTGCAIVPGGLDVLDKELRRRGRRGVRRVRFGRGDDVELRATEIESEADRVSFRVNDGARVTIPTAGEHNVLNALAAMGAAAELGIGPGEAGERLASFRPPPMRLEVHRWGEVTLINDAYNANPASMDAAAGVLADWPDARRRVFVAGDMRELGEASLAKHQQLGRRIASAGVDVLVAVGEYAEAVAQTVRRENAQMHVDVAVGVEDAADRLGGIVRAGDVIMIKASRALGLEALVGTIEGLAERLPGEGRAG